MTEAEEIRKRIDELETADFYLQMKDMWSQEDFDTHDAYYREVKALKEKLNELEEKIE